MTRLLFALMALSCLAAVTGCTMCSHVYDDCPPTFGGGGCGTCDPLARANSVLSTPLAVSYGSPAVGEGEVFYEMPGTGQLVPAN